MRPRAAADVEPPADGQPKKKRTRRGTRGGRGRKKLERRRRMAPAGGAGRVGERSSRPRIHVPPADLEEATGDEVTEQAVTAVAEESKAPEALGADGQPKKKRARRGARGGRKRRKPAATGGDEPSATDEPEDSETAATDGAPEYVPMSEWIEDFDATRQA